jgi:hypothetical protein
MKLWWILGLLATIFVVLGAVLMVFLASDPAGLGAGGVFLVVGLGLWWPALQMRREESLDEHPAPAATPGGVAFAEVAERIRARLADKPYTVDTEGSTIRIRADLADATFLTWAAAHRVREVRGTDVVGTAPGQAIIRDIVLGFELSGGRAGVTGEAHAFSGRSWSYSRRIEYGFGTDGTLGRQVDIDFATTDISGPVIDVLKETGWYTSWFAAQSAETKGAIVMGAVGGLGAVAAVVAVLVQKLSG